MYNFLIDSHAHLYAEEFDHDREEMLARARAAGVERFYLPNVDVDSIRPMLDLAAQHPESCFPMMGLHPCSVLADYKSQLQVVENHLFKDPERANFCAVGEIGLDYYWSTEFVTEQQYAFRTQCRWAIKLNLPVVIHARNSLVDLINIVSEPEFLGMKGVFHCFSGDLAQAQKLVELGFYLGIGGVVTFKNGGLDKFIHQLPLEKLILETDAPYLTPAPYRGKRNEAAYIELVAQRLVDLLKIDYQTIMQQTTANALSLFNHLAQN